MASISVRNLASHIAAVAFVNFIPITEKWDAPKNLPAGAKKMLELLKMVTGSHFKPIFPAFLLNEDCSSQYYFSGSMKNDHSNNGWSHVTETSLERRSTDSMWISDKAQDNVCKGIRVKFACGGSAAGFLYPICILVSNLNQQELPSDDFIVVPIPGLAVNGHIDPRCEEVGYLCLMGQNVSQKRFFDWFYEKVTIPTCNNIRKKI